MTAAFFRISPERRLEALKAASSVGAVHILEKDCWVVWALRELFDTDLGEHLVFKGGTSLSKGYRAINRFSEDIDLTYNIRNLIPDLVGSAVDAIPPSRNQRKKWMRQIGMRLDKWITDSVLPVFHEAIRRDGLAAELSVEGDGSNKKLLINYERLTASSNSVGPPVILEFGASSTGEPSELRHIVCDAAAHLNSLSFPEVRARVLRIERTVWEKATAMHVYCLQKL